VDGYPVEAVKYSLLNKEKAVPELLEILEYTLNNVENLSKDPKYLIHIPAIYLLAYFRETSAYESIIRIAMLPDEQIYDLLGDIVIDGFKNILASVCDGNIESIKAIIEDASLDEYVRTEALEALLTLLNYGVVSREELLFYFKELFNGKLDVDYSAVWDELPRLCSMIHPFGLKGDIEKAVAEGKVMEIIADLDFMEKQLKRPVKEVLGELKQDGNYSFISEEDVYSLESWIEELLCEVSYECEDGYEEEYEDEYDYEDMEDWEDEYDLFEEKDWKGLVEYRNRKAERHPNDPEYQWGLGEAYVLNREYEKAIDLLSDLHKDYPDDPNIQNSLLDALFAIGKDETAVEWAIQPNILRLDRSVLDYCYDFMKKKRKPRTVYELYLEFYKDGYPAFNGEQLMAFLHSDNRFLITESNTVSQNCFVSVIKKGKG
jgi:hypothetical protein